MKNSARVFAACVAVLVAVGCDSGEKATPTQTPPPPDATATTPPPAPPVATPPATPPVTTPPVTTPTLPGPEPTTAVPEPPPPAEATGIEGVGPFKSIAAYCKDVKSKFVADDCKSPLDGGANVCNCSNGKGVIQGKRKIGPLPEATGLASAELLLVARGAADEAHCDLAIETANGRGWLMVPALMPCSEAPMSHDSSTSVTVKRFEVTREGEVDVLTLEWSVWRHSEGVDGDKSESREKVTTRCTIGETTMPRCATPSPQ